jgi:hypothetical protein
VLISPPSLFLTSIFPKTLAPITNATTLVNDARAIRIAEIMTDFRNLQYYLVQLRPSPTAEEYYLEGYSLLRQCIEEAQSILAKPFAATSSPSEGDVEKQKQQLR